MTGLAFAGPACSNPPERQAATRIAPPAGLTCPRDALTSFNGAVTRYRRDADAAVLTIATDWGTSESVRVDLAGDLDTGPFRYEGRPFSPEDWSRVEIEPGRLKDGVRVIAWMCEDGVTPPVIDWRGE